MDLLPEQIAAQVAIALEEDLGGGDLTAGLIPADQRLSVELICRQQAVICGRPWFDQVFRQLDSEVVVDWKIREGQSVTAGQRLCTLQGPARALLTGERTAMNYLQTLSGTASLARRYADAVAGTGARILDTRKTTPGMRLLEKEAVRLGGGVNHRFGLFDMVLIKDNHVDFAGGIEEAILGARSYLTDHKLDLDISNRHHAGSRFPGGVWVVGHLRIGIGNCCYQCRFTDIGRTDYRHLTGTFLVYVKSGISFADTFFTLAGAFEFGDFFTQIRA